MKDFLFRVSIFFVLMPIWVGLWIGFAIAFTGYAVFSMLRIVRSTK